MKSACVHRVWIVPVLICLSSIAPGVHADFFSWETGFSGAFTDPNQWHGPNFPDHTRFPGAADDATIDRGSLTVTISGKQATRELVTGQPTLAILGSYTVAQLSAYGSPLTVMGGGQLETSLWLMGARAVLDGATARVATLQPLGAGQGPSEWVVRNGAEASSQVLDQSRGGLRVIVEGAGSVWKHATEVPYMEIILQSGGRAEVPSTDDVYVNADGGGAVLTVAARFKGYGRIANGARIVSAEGVRSGGGNTTLDAGSWAVLRSFVNDAGDLTIQNGGILSARDVGSGQFSGVTFVEGAGSQMVVANLLNHRGGIQLRQRGSLTCAEARLDNGIVYAETGGAFAAKGDIFCNSSLNLFDGGILNADGVFIADIAGRDGSMSVVGSRSSAELTGGLAVGQRGAGVLSVRDRGRVGALSGGMGLFAGSHGDVAVSGAFSEWSIHGSSAGGGLLVGGAGTGVLRVESGGAVRVNGSAVVVVGREPGGAGSIRLRGFGSVVDASQAPIVVGQGGQGVVEADDSSGLRADRLIVGRSSADNRVTVSGQDTLLGVLDELVVGEGGRGTFELRRGAQGVVRRLVVGRESRADNVVVIGDPGTRLSGSDRIDVGEWNGRGRLEMFSAAEARPSAGLSVGIYDGSDGSLLLDRDASIVTPKDVIVGGGAGSVATATIRGGGVLDAMDILIFAKPGASATVVVTNLPSYLSAARDIQIGFGRGLAGTTLMRAGDGALVSAGADLTVGVGGRLEVLGARVAVGATEFPPSGTVRVGPGGRLTGAGRVQGRVEIVSGGAVFPGSSPGTLTLEGDYAQTAGARLEIEISGAPASARYDVLELTGSASIGGSLVIHFVDGFAPKAGQRFEFLTAAGGIRGAFAGVEVTGVAAGFAYTLAPVDADGLSLVAENDGVATTAPELEIVAGEGSAVLSWAANGNWILESSSGLPGTWHPVPDQPVIRNDRYFLSLPDSASVAFYRLRP